MFGSCACGSRQVSINVVFNVHTNYKAYQGRGEGSQEGGKVEVGGEGDCIPIATLSPPE